MTQGEADADSGRPCHVGNHTLQMADPATYGITMSKGLARAVSEGCDRFWARRGVAMQERSCWHGRGRHVAKGGGA